jgi:hypothetical protein
MQHIAVLQFHFTRHALPTAGAAFQVSHPHDVIKRHPQGQPTRGVAAGGMAVQLLWVGRGFQGDHAL